MDNQNQITAIQYAELHGLDWDGVKSALYRNGFGSGKHMVLKPEMIDAISAKKTGVSKPVKSESVVSAVKEPQPVKTEKQEPKLGVKTGVEPVKETGFKTVLIWLIIAAPTVASAKNITAVCLSIMGEPIGGFTLAAVICLTSMALTYVGMKSKLSQWLIWFVLSFETLANVTVIYDGLMGGTGNPTRFLGVVTTIFTTGTHGTAIVLAVFAALLLAGAQFAGLFELKKRA